MEVRAAHHFLFAVIDQAIDHHADALRSAGQTGERRPAFAVEGVDQPLVGRGGDQMPRAVVVDSAVEPCNHDRAVLGIDEHAEYQRRSARHPHQATRPPHGRSYRVDLLEEPLFEERIHDLRHRRGGKPGDLSQPGPRRGAADLQELEQSPLVDAAEQCRLDANLRGPHAFVAPSSGTAVVSVRPVAGNRLS